jgi:hypothetical protein
MIVEREVFKAKPGCMSDLVALARTGGDLASPPHAWRLYSIKFGANDSLALEWEFESEAQRDAFWAEWLASPKRPGFMERFIELTVAGGMTEIWTREV